MRRRPLADRGVLDPTRNNRPSSSRSGSGRRRTGEHEENRTGVPPAEDVLETVYGLHPVKELLDARAAEVERVLASREKSRGIGPLLKQARLLGIPVTYLERETLGRKLGRGVNHQGIAAIVAAKAYVTVDDLIEATRASEDANLVLLDRVVDPGNLGAILRTAAGAGVAGVILSADGTAGLGPAVARSSAGAMEKVHVARSLKPQRDLRRLQEEGFRVIGLDARGDRDWDSIDLTGRIVLVAGGEERGMRPVVGEACEISVRIPLAGNVESLNVGISVGVLLFEAFRQRRRAHPGP